VLSLIETTVTILNASAQVCSTRIINRCGINAMQHKAAPKEIMAVKLFIETDTVIIIGCAGVQL